MPYLHIDSNKSHDSRRVLFNLMPSEQSSEERVTLSVELKEAQGQAQAYQGRANGSSVRNTGDQPFSELLMV